MLIYFLCLVPPKGIINNGNTCYLSCSLQLIFRLLPSSKIIDGKYKQDPFASNLISVFQNMYSNPTQKIFQLKEFYQNFFFKKFNQFQFGIQQDCHETLVALIEHLSNFIDLNLCFNQQKHIVCKSSRKSSSKNDPLCGIILPLEKYKEFHLDDLMNDYLKEEQIKDYKCESKDCQQNYLKIVFSNLPEFLLITVARFNHQIVMGESVSSKVNFPVVFPLKNWDLDVGQEISCYDLSAFICHQGISQECGIILLN
jgi:uncharacterized UBP type Zn finger protein